MFGRLRCFPSEIPHSFLGGGKKWQNVEILKHSKNIGGSSGAIRSEFVTCVPCVVARRPGQVPGEGERQVENPPGQNNDVIEVQQSHDHLGAITKTCRDDILVHSTEILLTKPVEAFSCTIKLHLHCLREHSDDTPVLPTFKQGTDFSPAGDAPLAGVLAQSYLQEEDRNATGEQEDQVGDEECT